MSEVRPPEIETAVAKALVTKAREFQSLAPWKWITNNIVLGVEENHRVRLFSILGNAKQVFGFVSYTGREGVRLVLKIISGEIDPSHKSAGYQREGLSVEFVPKSQLEGYDIHFLNEAEDPSVKKRQRYPQFRSYVPGFCAWYLTNEEAIQLTTDLERAMVFARLVEQNLEMFVQRARLEIPFIQGDLLDFQLSDLKWHRVAIPGFDPIPEYPGIPADDKLSKLPLNSTWEVDTFFARAIISESPRPYFAKFVLVVQAGTGFIVHHHMGHPSEKDAHLIGISISKAIKTHGYRPETLYVKDKRLGAALEKFSKKLKIELKVRNELLYLEEARDALEQFIKTGKMD